MENLDFSREPSQPEHSQSEIELTLPHFDDEETIQSARPVVPLHEVRKASQTKQRLLLGGALCVAAVVGALTAAWIGGPQPVQEPSAATNETSPLRADFVTPSSEASGATVDPNEAVALESEATNSGDGDLTVESNPPPARQPLNKNTRTPQKVEKVIPPQVSGSDNESVSSDEDLLRERRREARLRRERRIEARRSDDGLTRIREIFEGSPRP
jgi:hypothetical protein